MSGGGETRVHLLRQASVDNHAVVVEPGHQVLLVGRAALTLAQIWI